MVCSGSSLRESPPTTLPRFSEVCNCSETGCSRNTRRSESRPLHASGFILLTTFQGPQARRLRSIILRHLEEPPILHPHPLLARCHMEPSRHGPRKGPQGSFRRSCSHFRSFTIRSGPRWCRRPPTTSSAATTSYFRQRCSPTSTRSGSCRQGWWW